LVPALLPRRGDGVQRLRRAALRDLPARLRAPDALAGHRCDLLAHALRPGDREPRGSQARRDGGRPWSLLDHGRLRPRPLRAQRTVRLAADDVLPPHPGAHLGNAAPLLRRGLVRDRRGVLMVGLALFALLSARGAEPDPPSTHTIPY